MAQTNGYPDQSVIEALLAALGIEGVTEWNTSFFAEWLNCLYGLAAAGAWAATLRVYADSATTINLVGGRYVAGGEQRTYTPGTSINPTDNDTTVVWLDADGAVGSGIDGDGWPATEHVKLAEVDVDSDGIVTAIRDLRGMSFLRAPALTRPQPFILKVTLAAGATVAVYTADAPLAFAVIDAWSIAGGAAGGTWKVTDGTNDITNAVSVTATDKTVDRVGTIDAATSAIAEGGSLSVVGDGSLAACEVYLACMPVV